MSDIEVGLGMIKRMSDAHDRPRDRDLRILMFTATYFVLDGVTLTIRRLESHLRASGATVKILTTVPDDIEKDQLENVIAVPGIKIPFADAGTGYAFGVGLDENIVREIERFNPNCVHFTVPDFVALDGIRWCQRNNVAYIATWHSNYVDYLKYYFIEWVLGPAFQRYLKGFYEQIPAVYIPTPYVSVDEKIFVYTHSFIALDRIFFSPFIPCVFASLRSSQHLPYLPEPLYFHSIADA